MNDYRNRYVTRSFPFLNVAWGGGHTEGQESAKSLEEARVPSQNPRRKAPPAGYQLDENNVINYRI